MGSEYQRDGKWVVSWRDAGGRWREKRTTCATKAAARRLREDLERQAERQHLGLEPLVSELPQITLGELMDWYWERHGPKLRSTTLHFTLDKHVRPELGQLQLSEITAECIDELLTRKREEISAETHNKVISKLRRMFVLAARPGVGMWRGPNPLATVERRRIPKRLPTTLSADEVPLLLAELRGQDQGVVATALYTAMRKGELGGLLKTDIDLPQSIIKLQRCWDGSATKDGKPLFVPIAPSLRPYLEAALAASDSQFVFPAPDGAMHRPDVKWDVKLRRALGRAGIVVGFEHRCRRKGCGFKEQRATAEASRCPRCEFRLYAKPVPRHVRFHDLRHTTATLLLKEGVSLAVVSKLLRHSDPAITLGTYGHLDIDDLREAVDRLPFGPANGPAASDDAPGSGPQLGAPVARNSRSAKNEGRDASENPNNIAAFRWSGRLDLNQRPLAPQVLSRTV